MRQIKSRETVFSNKWSYDERISFSRGSTEKELFTTFYGRRAAIALVKNRSVYVVKQYRYLIDDYSWELPGGKVERGETEEEGAIRECFEETNCLCESVEPLVSFHPGLDTLFNPTTIFFSGSFKEYPFVASEEILDIKWTGVKEIIDDRENNNFRDALTIIGLQALIIHERVSG